MRSGNYNDQNNFFLFKEIQKAKQELLSTESELELLRNENNYLQHEMAFCEVVQANVEKNILALLNAQKIDPKQGEPAEPQTRPNLRK